MKILLWKMTWENLCPPNLSCKKILKTPLTSTWPSKKKCTNLTRSQLIWWLKWSKWSCPWTTWLDMPESEASTSHSTKMMSLISTLPSTSTGHHKDTHCLNSSLERAKVFTNSDPREPQLNMRTLSSKSELEVDSYPSTSSFNNTCHLRLRSLDHSAFKTFQTHLLPTPFPSSTPTPLDLSPQRESSLQTEAWTISDRASLSKMDGIEINDDQWMI